MQRDRTGTDGVTFVGCTLWSTFHLFGLKREAEAIIETRRCLSAYRVISFDKKKTRVIEPTDTRAIHRKDITHLPIIELLRPDATVGSSPLQQFISLFIDQIEQ